ncbi:MAG: ParB/RepB/Spo0J family partition protein [Proteobacteria bacterium]|nr:ParB/RepB/Spo0J family partition protein [Pseudomonadota bacterium]
MSKLKDKLTDKKTKLSSLQERLKDHPANLNNYEDGNFYFADINMILSSPDQPRKYFNPDTLAELSTSIKEKGVLQPVVIRKTNDGNIILVAGERRLKAAKMAGLEKIPAILTSGNPAEIALIENLQREDLKPIEIAEALNRMMWEYGYTHEQLAAVIGKARSTVTEMLSLVKLPDEIKEESRRADNYPRRLLTEVAKQDTPEKMIALFNRAKEGNLKSDQIREVTRKKSARTKITLVEIAIEKISSLNKQLQTLDLQGADEGERLSFVRELQGLEVTIGKLLRIVQGR